jgi:hypothetical protein
MTYTRLNATGGHAVIAKNYSRSGMFFESETNLPPGTDIVLRPMDCEGPDTSGADIPKPYFCSGTVPTAGPCLELRFHTIATVQRCVALENPDAPPRYGIAVDFVYLQQP